MARALVACLVPPSQGRPWQTGARRLRTKRHAANGQSAAASGSSKTLTQGIGKSALTCGIISSIGDVLAQALTRNRPLSEDSVQEKVGNVKKTDVYRTARMGMYGTAFYGPFQHVWYRLLDKIWPTKQFNHFLCKLLANQFALGPITLVTSFTWTYVLLNKQNQLGGKLRRDGLQTLQNGWKFWIPAASLNFLLVPLRLQVLFMSLCGVCWTGYLSNQTNK